MRLMLAPLLLVACKLGDDGVVDSDSSPDTETDTDTDSDTDSDTHTDTDDTNLDTGLPSPFAGLYFDQACNDAAKGSTSWLVGEYRIAGPTDVGGRVSWVHLANDAAKAAGQGDCSVVWDVTSGEKLPTETCGRCEFKLRANWAVDEVHTDCPSSIYDDSGQTQYELDVSGGDVHWYYPSTSDAGDGHTDGTWYTITTGPLCSYF